MGEQANSHEYTPMSAYRRYYNDLHSLSETGDRVIALKNLTFAIAGHEIKDTDIQREVFTDDGLPDPEKLLMFPITTLGPFLEQIDGSKIYDNYLTAFQCINWFADDHMDAGCNDMHKIDAPCTVSDTCVVKEVIKFCVDPATDTLFRTDIEYIDHVSRYRALQIRLRALRDSKLVDAVIVEQHLAYFRKVYGSCYGSLPIQTNPEN